MIVVLGILACIAALVYLYFTRTFSYWKNRNVAYRKPVPMFGNFIESALRKKFNGIVSKELYDEFPNEKVIGIYRMTTPALLLRDLDVVKDIMIKDFDTFTSRGIELSKKTLGQNLFHADSETWRVLRNKFTPIFTSGKLKNMMHLLNERGDKFIEYIQTERTGETEVHSLVQKYTMSSIIACAFGYDLDFTHKMYDTLRKIDKLTLELNFFNELDMMYPGLLKTIGSSIFPVVVKDFFYNLAKTVMTERGGKPTNRNDFMDLILELKNLGQVQGSKQSKDGKNAVVDFDYDIIAAQAFVFFVGGYETSATTLAFLLYHLAKNPDIQDKVIAEIDTVIPDTKAPITYDHLTELKYMTQVFDETLRMYPIVDPVQRVAEANYKIAGTDVTIEKGTIASVSILGIHHDKKYYPNPEKFDPERFHPSNAQDRHSCAYMPFGVGPRNCIGMRFAKVQSRMCLVKLLSNYRVECSKNTKISMDFASTKALLAPKGGVFLNLTPRRLV